MDGTEQTGDPSGVGCKKELIEFLIEKSYNPRSFVYLRLNENVNLLSKNLD